MKRAILRLGFALMLVLPAFAQTSALLDAMSAEMDRASSKLKKAGDAPLYFLSYSVTEENALRLTAKFGALDRINLNTDRYMDIDVRVGSMALDNTHQVSGGDWFGYLTEAEIPDRMVLEDDKDAIRQLLWLATEARFKRAQEDFMKVKGDVAVKVEKQDTSADFSKAKAETFIGPLSHVSLDTIIWKKKIADYSSHFNGKDFILESSVSVWTSNVDKYIVNSEGTKIRMSRPAVFLSVFASTKASDGMEMYLYESFYGRSSDELPGDDIVIAKIDSIINNLKVMQKAPTVEPFTGPAILRGKASGVFFHEIFGHRIEGHRQKNETEGQTFTKKVGQSVLPDFISVYDDPSMELFNGKPLNGFYPYDDEGVKSERVTVVDKGILKNFLMSRSPVAGFKRSNGHGRRQHGNDIVSRQANLIVESSKSVPFAELKKMLIDECKKQGKPWGLVFEDISGGFTMTMRFLPQSFKVQPLKVWRVYTDGRPDELVRGVDIVGTPLTSFSKIIATGDEPNVGVGTCGAESGMVPVSMVSPSVLVSQIEVEKKYKGQDKPPILPPPSKK